MILDNGGRFKNKAAPGHAFVIPAKARLHPCRRASMQASFRWNDDNDDEETGNSHVAFIQQ